MLACCVLHGDIECAGMLCATWRQSVLACCVLHGDIECAGMCVCDMET